MEHGKRPIALTLLSALLALTGVATAAFWVLFFSGRIQATETEQDDAFEKAFPLADSWMIACCMYASLNIIRLNRRGFLAGTAAASALLFLACMDILYSLENKKYIPLNADRAQMLGIHIWAAGLGTSTMCLLWKHRKLLMARD